MTPEELKRTICSSFCGALSVTPLASGYAVSSPFEDGSGDRLSFYLLPSPDGFIIEDDGGYLADLIAKDIPIDQGQRGNMLDAILSQGGAYWDRETFEIKTPSFSAADTPRRVLDFLSAMIRVRDLEMITRDVVRSTFREDATALISKAFGTLADIEEGQPIKAELSEFPADLVIRPGHNAPKAKSGAIYFASTNDKLNEALLLKLESERLLSPEFEVVALLEDHDFKGVSRKRFQRAQNRDLAMPIFRGDEIAAMQQIGRKLNLHPSLI